MDSNIRVTYRSLRSLSPTTLTHLVDLVTLRRSATLTNRGADHAMPCHIRHHCIMFFHNSNKEARVICGLGVAVFPPTILITGRRPCTLYMGGTMLGDLNFVRDVQQHLELVLNLNGLLLHFQGARCQDLGLAGGRRDFHVVDEQRRN